MNSFCLFCHFAFKKTLKSPKFSFLKPLETLLSYWCVETSTYSSVSIMGARHSPPLALPVPLSLFSSLRVFPAGVQYVFDTTLAAGFSILESQKEFIQRYRRRHHDPHALPMFTSSCPGKTAFSSTMYSSPSSLFLFPSCQTDFLASWTTLSPNICLNFHIFFCLCHLLLLRLSAVQTVHLHAVCWIVGDGACFEVEIAVVCWWGKIESCSFATPFIRDRNSTSKGLSLPLICLLRNKCIDFHSFSLQNCHWSRSVALLNYWGSALIIIVGTTVILFYFPINRLIILWLIQILII